MMISYSSKKKRRSIFFSVFFLFGTYHTFSQQTTILENEDLAFLHDITKAVLDSSRILPGQSVASEFGPNRTGGILIRPGGRNAYPAFWIRDYAMSLECGMIPLSEQKHMLLLTARSQCDQSWISKNGSLVPYGSIPDHIRIDNSLPIYFPGTYDYIEQGNRVYGMTPPYCDQYYFIQMAHYYLTAGGRKEILIEKVNDVALIDRLEIAFGVPPVGKPKEIVTTRPEFRGVDFGFRDGIQITGDLCFSSILRYNAALQLSELFRFLKRTEKSTKYKLIAEDIAAQIPVVFQSESGMLKASTGWSSQPDVWATAFAVYSGALKGKSLNNAANALATACQQGTISLNGNIRHVPVDKDFNSKSSWEKTDVDKNVYQNGAYWGTPVGWVSFAISKVDMQLAKKLAREYISDLRENDFRKGIGFGAPFECFFPPGYYQNPIYLTSVSCPYIAFKKLSADSNTK